MLKIGEFSKISRVSIRMLRHYDDKEKMDAFLSERQKELTKLSRDTQVYGEACIRKGLSQMQH